MLPFLEVSHLPSSSSFYSAIVQPLGLRYTSTESCASDPVAVTYGAATLPHPPVFQLRQINPSDRRPLKISRIVLTVHSQEAVGQFLAFASRAGSPLAIDPAANSSGTRLLNQPSSPDRTADMADNPKLGQRRARVTDFDGNMMEVIYVPSSDYPSHFSGSTTGRTRPTHDEASRIIDWDYDVATTSSAQSIHDMPRLAVAERSDRFPDGNNRPALRRTVTSTRSTTSLIPAASPLHSPSMPSTGTVISTLLGVAAGAAAGAALTYSIVKKDRANAPRQDFDQPAFRRRATFPEPFSGHPSSHVEVDRTVEEVYYPEERARAVDPGPRTLTGSARYSRKGPSPCCTEDGIDDGRSSHFPRSRAAAAPSVRARSEATAIQKPLMLSDVEHRSHSGSSRLADVPPPSRGLVSTRHGTACDAHEHESYVSARSHKTASTIRAPPWQEPAQMTPRSQMNSVASAASMNNPVRYPTHVTPSRATSGTRSHISARNVPLPPSDVAGSSHAGWEEDVDSIAPSDSISCVGGGRGGSSY